MQISDFPERARQDSNLRPSLFVVILLYRQGGTVGDRERQNSAFISNLCLLEGQGETPGCGQIAVKICARKRNFPGGKTNERSNSLTVQLPTATTKSPGPRSTSTSSLPVHTLHPASGAKLNSLPFWPVQSSLYSPNCRYYSFPETRLPALRVLGSSEGMKRAGV